MKRVFTSFIGYLKIHESEPLQQNFVFWVATITPIFIAVSLSMPLVIKGLIFDFSTEGYEFFLNCFKFPLWVSSSSLIFGVMVGRFHGSAQRASTLSATKEQNNFSNYLNHRDHFQKYMQNVADEFDIKVDAFKIYGILFSESSPEQVVVKLSDNICEFLNRSFEDEFWSKMRFSAQTTPFESMEVNIYFPRFARAVGINAEKLKIYEYNELKGTLVKIRKIYRRAMEYGFTRINQPSSIEIEDNGISMLIGDFDSWANENKFKQVWKIQ